MTFYVILRGPLGAGKTTLARELAERIGGETIAIDPILERWEWDGGSESLFLRANRVAVDQALPALRRGRPVVFDGNFYWRSAIDDLVERLPYPHSVFTLKVPLRTCIERDRTRSPSYGEEGAREVFDKVARFDYGTDLDATGSVGQTLAALIDELLRSRRIRPRAGAAGTRTRARGTDREPRRRPPRSRDRRRTARAGPPARPRA